MWQVSSLDATFGHNAFLEPNEAGRIRDVRLCMGSAITAIRTAGGIPGTALNAERGLQSSIAGVRAESLGLTTSFEAASAAGQAEALTMSEIADRSEILRAEFTQLKTLLGIVARMGAECSV